MGPDQIKAFRAYLGWSTPTLAQKSGLTILQVVRAEGGDGRTAVQAPLVQAIQSAFEIAGLEFAPRDEGDVAAPQPITGSQIRAARRLLGWSAATLAKRAQRSLMLIAKAESDGLGFRHRDASLRAIQTALEQAGVEFTAQDGGGIGVRVKQTAP